MASATIPLHSKSVSIPSEVCHWSTDRLADEAVRAIQTCRKHGQAAAQSAWRAGAYLSLLHTRLIKGRKWATWLRQQKEIVTEHTARRYILLYERSEGRVSELDGMTLTEAYVAFGITRFTEIGSSNDSEPDHRYRLSNNGVHKLASILPGTQIRDSLDPDDEEGILRAATVIRQQRIAERGRLEVEKEEAARVKLNGKRTWTLTDNPKVVQCDLLVADPPFGITDEPWEPKDVESFTRSWCDKWSKCGADFIAIFWCQERLWEGRTWFDQSLKGYEFQQLLTWQANNHCGPKSRQSMKQSWYPIFLYRKRHSSRRIVRDDKAWDTERHNLDCHVAPLPQTTYRGEELKQHPCQKPVSVMRWLINALSEPTELVCSLFCGVAPCGVAAVQLGRRYRGIEQSAEYRKIAEGRIAAYKDQPKDDDQDEDESPDRRTYYNFRLGKLRPRACDQETPPGLARFLFEIISPAYKAQTILDPCAGRGALTKPWRGRRVISFEVEAGKDFFECPNRIECDLVLCNPPFSQDGECSTGYQPERFLRRIVEVVPRHTPIVLITPMGMRLHHEKRSKRWRWLRDEAPPITSIISLPRDTFPAVDYHVEILLFDMPRLKPHYFVPDRYL